MYPLPIGQFDRPFNPDSVFSVPPDARRKHVAIFGKSGTGKSVLMGNMLFSDIRHGLGVTVLDPHGGLVERALEMIPRSRTNDVIYFRPYDLDRVLGINILDVTGEKERALAVSHLLSIFKALWADSWGPRMEDILRNAAFALIEQPQPQSLLAIPRLLSDPNYRRQILKHVSNPAVQAFFHVYDEVWDRRFRAEAISPVLNKVNAFVRRIQNFCSTRVLVPAANPVGPSCETVLGQDIKFRYLATFRESRLSSGIHPSA